MEIKKGIKTDWGQNKKVKQKKSNKCICETTEKSPEE
jgi:hypothetical protein